MKKIFLALIVGMFLLTANTSFAAKLNPLAEISAEDFYQNLGYEVDCSHFERVDGKIVFRTILPEEPLTLSKDLPNVLVYNDTRRNYVVEIDLYLDDKAEKNLKAAFIAKVIAALDEETFKNNQASIEDKIDKFLSAPVAETTLNISDKRQYKIFKEVDQGTLAVYIEGA